MSTWNPPPVPRFGLGIDWETSGYSLPNYAASHQGISFGAVVFDLKTFDPIETLYREIKFDSTKHLWDMGAERVHGMTREYLAANGVAQEEAALELGNLVIKYFAAEKMTVLGHRAYFDECFTTQLMATIDVELNYDPVKIDSAAFGLTFLGVTSSNQLFQLAGCPPRSAHNSLEDILYTLASVKAIKNGLR